MAILFPPQTMVIPLLRSEAGIQLENSDVTPGISGPCNNVKKFVNVVIGK